MDDGKLMIGEKYVLVEKRKKMDENRNRLKYMQNAGQLISATSGKMSADLAKYVQETFILLGLLPCPDQHPSASGERFFSSLSSLLLSS